MKKNILIVLFAILIIGCGQNQKETKPDPNSRQVAIDFAEISVSLPKIFKRVSPDELIDAIRNMDSTEISESERFAKIERVDMMKSTNMQFYTYVDTTNINNTVIFLAAEYLKLDKEVIQYILSNADKTITSQWSEEGINLKRVDNQFFAGEKVQILKLKYELMGTELIGYWTSYLVTTNSNTFQVFVTRSDIEDYESRITRLRLGL